MRLTPLLAASLVLAGCYNEAIPLRDLAARHQITTGTVTFRDCAKYGSVRYAFMVNGRSHTGFAPSGSVNCTAASVGDPVTVYYDPANPAVHTLKEPQRLYEEKRGFHVPAWLAVPLLFMLAFAAIVFNARSKRVPSPGMESMGGRKASRPVREQDEHRRFARAQFETWLKTPSAAQLALGPEQHEIVLESETGGGHREGPDSYTLTRFLRNAEGRYVLFKSTPKGPYVKLIADDVAKAALKSRWVAPAGPQG